jgi:hypothetical protein
MTSKYGAYALHASLSRLPAHTRMHTPTSQVTHMHARTHTHTNKSHERASMLRYTYLALFV